MNKCIAAKKVFSIRLGFLCFLISLFSGCSELPEYEKNIPITNRSWSHKQIPEFRVHITSTNRSFDIFLNLRHSPKYKFSNLSLIIEETDPKQQEKDYPLVLQLANEDGLWKGVGTGNILGYQVPIIKNYHFLDTGIYTFRIKQNMRIDPLPEIFDIGILITNSKIQNLRK